LEDYFNETFNEQKSLSDWEILHQLTLGLHHLHNLGIVHRDIKPTNIFVQYENMNGRTEAKMKLADFGLAKVLKADKEDFTNTNVANPAGTKGWMAPEVYESNRFDFKVDIWALGLIFAYTLTKENKHPFGDNSNERIVRIIRKEPMVMVKENLKEAYSRDDVVAFELILSMLQMDPLRRPTVRDMLEKSPFFFFNMVIGIIPKSLCQNKYKLSVIF